MTSWHDALARWQEDAMEWLGGAEMNFLLRSWRHKYGSLDGLDVSFDGLNIPVFLNSLDIFDKRIVLLSLLQLGTVQ